MPDHTADTAPAVVTALPPRFLSLPQQKNPANTIKSHWYDLFAAPLLPRDYLRIFDVMHEVTDLATHKEREDIHTGFRQFFFKWEQGFAADMSHLTADDIGFILRQCRRIGVTLKNGSFEGLENQIRHHHTYNIDQKINILAEMALHTWVPVDDIYTKWAADFVRATPALTVHQIKRLYYTTALLEAVAGEKTPNSRSIAYAFANATQTRLNKSSKNIKRLFVEDRIFYEAGRWFDAPHVPAIPTLAFSNTSSDQEEGLRVRFARAGFTVIDPHLELLAKDTDIALQIGSNVVCIEFDGPRHFLELDGAPVYDGGSIFRTALAAKTHPDRLFLQLPYFNLLRNKQKDYDALLALFAQLQPNPSLNQGILRRSGNAFKIQQRQNSHYIRPAR